METVSHTRTFPNKNQVNIWLIAIEYGLYKGVYTLETGQLRVMEIVLASYSIIISTPLYILWFDS